MPHIHNEAGQADLTVSGFIILQQSGSEPKLLLHRHKKLGVLLQMGGHVELDETPWNAVAREIEEESGYSFADLKVLQPKHRLRSIGQSVLHPTPLVVTTHTFRGGQEHYHTDIEYAFVAKSLPQADVADGESLDLGWYTQEHIAALGEDDVYEDIHHIANFIFDTALIEYEAVPTDKFSRQLPRF